MKREVLSDELFLFVSRNRKRATILYFDGTGMCLFAKRLERRQFAAPWKQRRHEMTLSELTLFIEQRVDGPATAVAAVVAADRLDAKVPVRRGLLTAAPPVKRP